MAEKDMVNIVNFPYCNRTPSIIRPKPESESVLRSSKRVRVQTLDFWRLQQVLYQRDQTTGLDSFLDVYQGSTVEKSKVTPKKGKRKRAICHNGDDSESENTTQSKRKKNKRHNILDLSIHDAKMRELYKDNYNRRKNCSNPKLIHFVDEFKWKQAESGPDVHVVTNGWTNDTLVGIFKLAPKGQKKKQTTSDYVTHLTIISGAVSIQIESDPEVILKTASYFMVPESTQYMVKNLREDEAFIAFTLVQLETDP